LALHQLLGGLLERPAPTLLHSVIDLFFRHK
jgi:hypothetical protein